MMYEEFLNNIAFMPHVELSNFAIFIDSYITTLTKGCYEYGKCLDVLKTVICEFNKRKLDIPILLSPEARDLIENPEGQKVVSPKVKKVCVTTTKIKE